MATNHSEVLTSLPYLGGKSPLAPQRVGRWIADRLPVTQRYCEPFAGMCGVLLQRPAVAQEIINDIDGRISGWWRTLRDNYEEFCDRLWRTPQRTEEALEWAVTHLDDPDPVTAALALTVTQISAAAGRSFRLQLSRGAQIRILTEANVRRLADRMSHVTVLSRDACSVLERVARFSDMVIYVDPPYRSSAGGRLYDHHKVDIGRLTSTLLSQSGFVAISGYDEEWEHLGWRRLSKGTYSSFTMSYQQNAGQPERVERLWINYTDRWSDVGLLDNGQLQFGDLV